MSIRSSLLIVTISVGVLVGAIVGLVSILNLNRNIQREAQERVNHDLMIASAEFSDRLEILAENMTERGKDVEEHVRELQEDTDTSAGLQREISQELQTIKESLDLTVLNICGPDGEPLIGSFPEDAEEVPVEKDPVLRRALLGSAAFGTVLLDADRLRLEGGVALAKAAVVYQSNGPEEPVTRSALFWWAAVPVKDADGRIVALLYGGRMLNYNFEIVDRLQGLIYGEDIYNGKPVGTVTIFLGTVRVATNVKGPDNSRAIGTRVSREVAEKVLEGGERWNARALVVDAWYISGYQPISEPDGNIIGMLYAGLLEAPYREISREVVFRVVWPALVLLAVAVAVSLFLIRRITSPLRDLSEAASHLKEANWDYKIETTSNFSEIAQLTEVFQDMQEAIAARDKTLQEKNKSLEEKNRNYMEMLGFITHELKSPMTAAQQMINVVLDGFIGDMPEKTAEILERIRRALEQSQDMVKNYLDLSRAERGELEVNKTEIELRKDVIDPVVEQTAQLFDWKKMELEVSAPEELKTEADSELLKIALTNYLNNAAKYGREQGKARLEIGRENGWINISVWNEGDGFTEEEEKKLFQKFSRLRNNASRGSRGSGLGLFLCRQIAELHGGKVDAQAELGKWARFDLRIPAGT
jgi:two-component system, NtrC family, sensor kinase